MKKCQVYELATNLMKIYL